jgi:hypothetical protein
VLLASLHAADELLDGRGLVTARLVTAAQSKLHARVSWQATGASRNFHYTTGRKRQDD